MLFPQQQTIVRGPIQSGVKRPRSPSPTYALYAHRLHQPPMKHQQVYSDHSEHLRVIFVCLLRIFMIIHYKIDRNEVSLYENKGRHWGKARPSNDESKPNIGYWTLF